MKIFYSLYLLCPDQVRKSRGFVKFFMIMRNRIAVSIIAAIKCTQKCDFHSEKRTQYNRCCFGSDGKQTEFGQAKKKTTHLGPRKNSTSKARLVNTSSNSFHCLKVFFKFLNEVSFFIPS